MVVPGEKETVGDSWSPWRLSLAHKTQGLARQAPSSHALTLLDPGLIPASLQAAAVYKSNTRESRLRVLPTLYPKFVASKIHTYLNPG